MKIVTWNCNGALRKKFHELNRFGADIYVIQECENPAEAKSDEYKEWAGNYLWMGDSENKGLAVFARQTIKIEKLNWSNKYEDHSVKHFLPCRINDEFNLLAVWTHRNNSPNFGYIGQLWKYLKINKANMQDAFLVGDLNSNAIWDQWDRWWNHTDVVKELSDLEIESAYHYSRNEEQGKETAPTLYLQRKKEKPYHIDFIFAPLKKLKTMNELRVGNFQDWITISDHMPVYCEFKK